MLVNFEEKYTQRYQEVFNKTLVAKDIATTRYQDKLVYGESITRISYDMSEVLVRDVTNLQDRIIDQVSDSEQTMPVNRQKGTTFPMSSAEKVQAGPLSPQMVLSRQAAIKLATYVDADVLSEIPNLNDAFDAGDLTSTVSNGEPIELTSITVPQMVAQAPAKLRAKNQILTNTVWVLDNYAVSQIAQYRLGKDIDTAGVEFRNGNTGADIGGGRLYVSENLTGSAVLKIGGSAPQNNDTMSIGGVTFTFKTSATVAGDIKVNTTMATILGYISDAINGVTNSNIVQVSASDRAKLTALGITAKVEGVLLKVTGIGSGRLRVAETFASGTNIWSENYINAYYGKTGAIDLVVQDKVDVELRDEPRQRTVNIFTDILYSFYLFDDGKDKALNVKIKA